MTGPVRTIAAKFTAEGSETVKRAIEQVTATATQASERAASAAKAAAARIVETQQVSAQMFQRSRQAAERAAYAEATAREEAARRAIAATQRVADAQMLTVARTGSIVQSRAATAAKSVAISLDMIASTGAVTREHLRRVATDAANMALLFGKGGPVLAAIGITGLALFNLFANARAERKKLEEESIDGLKRMVNVGDHEGMRTRQKELWEGTPAGDFKDGVAAIEASIAALSVAWNPDRETIAGFLARQRQIDIEREKLKPLREEYDRLTAAILKVNNTPRPAPGQLPAQVITPGVRPQFMGAPLEPRGTVDYSPLEKRADEALAGARRALLGDPEEFAKQLAKDIADALKGVDITGDEIIKKFRKLQTPLSNGIADSLLAGIGGGIAIAINSGSIGEAFRGLASTVLAGLGDMIAAIAVKAIAASALMIKFQSWLTLNPVAALGAAVALMALARAMGGGSRAGGASGGASSHAGYAGTAAAIAESSTRLVFGNNSVGTAAGMTPRQTNNVVIIGPDDPRAQRAITDLLRKAEGRGLSPARG